MIETDYISPEYLMKWAANGAFNDEDYRIPYCPKHKEFGFDSLKCFQCSTSETCADCPQVEDEYCDHSPCEFSRHWSYGGRISPPEEEYLCTFFGNGESIDLQIERERFQVWLFTGIMPDLEDF